jgi:broad specificity phosphatase PhoE
MGNIFLAIGISAIISFMPGSNASAQNKFQNSSVIDYIKKTYKDIRGNAAQVFSNGKIIAKQIRFIQAEDHALEDYSNLRQIALIRHGEPDMTKTGKFSGLQAAEYIVCYDSVCIIEPEAPFFVLGEQENVKIFSSPLNRALSTAHYLCGSDKDIAVSTDFREFDTNIKAKGRKFRMPIKFWTTTARIKWMLGFTPKGKESYAEAKGRARKASQTLMHSSIENPKILLFAHGMLNHYIKKDLEKNGWKVVEDTGNDYFGTSILVKIGD